MEIFSRGKREDLAKKEAAELRIIEEYLPEQMSPEEVERRVDEIFATLRQAQSGRPLDFGGVMRAVMVELKGKADAKFISEAVKRKLGA